MSSNPTGRVSRGFCAKNAATSMEAGSSWSVVASLEIFFSGFFAIIFWFFLHFYFAECKSLPSVFRALGEVFAECPTKNTRQSLFTD